MDHRVILQPPQDIPAMRPDELQRIGEALFGRWGWQTKLAVAMGVDGSTVRRWKAGTIEVPPHRAREIRAMSGRQPGAEGTTASPVVRDTPALRVLQLLAAIAAMPTERVSARVMRDERGVVVEVRVTARRRGAPDHRIVLREDEDFAGIDAATRLMPTQ